MGPATDASAAVLTFHVEDLVAEGLGVIEDDDGDDAAFVDERHECALDVADDLRTRAAAAPADRPVVTDLAALAVEKDLWIRRSDPAPARQGASDLPPGPLAQRRAVKKSMLGFSSRGAQWSAPSLSIPSREHWGRLHSMS